MQQAPHPHAHRRQWLAVIILCVCLLSFGIYWQLQPRLRQSVVELEPTPAPVSSTNITVFSPTMDSRVSKSFTITGKARVFENTLSIRVSDPLTGTIYASDHTMTNATEAGTFGGFTYTVTLSGNSPLKPGDDLLLEVFQNSAKDGSEIDTVRIPLTFTPLMP